MQHSIITNILHRLKNAARSSEDHEAIKQIIQLRYQSGLKSLSKFTMIGASMNRSSQTIRISLLRLWSKMDGKEEVVNIIERAINSALDRHNVTSLRPSELVQEECFQGMTGEDISTLLHDIIGYSELEVPFFFVRRHGQVFLTTNGRIDRSLEARQASRFTPLPIPHSSIPAVEISRAIADREDGSLLGDLGRLIDCLDSAYKNILVARIGIKGESQTLAHLGQQYGLTRERVRQVTINLINLIRSVDLFANGGPISRLSKIVDGISFNGKLLITLEDLVESHPYLHCFRGNEKGLFVLLSSAEVGNIMQHSGFYLLAPGVSPDHAIHYLNQERLAEIESKKKVKSDNVRQMMAVLPEDIIQEVKKVSRMKEVSANKFYSDILSEFAASNDPLPEIAPISWSEVGNTWRMVNMRLPVELVKSINTIAGKLKGSGAAGGDKRKNRSALIYSVIRKHHQDYLKAA